MKTYSTKASEIEREWHVMDASGKVLGRFITQVAELLMGKHKLNFARNLDMGDFVVVINAAKVRVTGTKAKQKLYYHHSGYLGGLKSMSYAEMMQTNPAFVIEHAAKGMLPQNHLRARMLKRLRVYPGDTHPYSALVGAGPTEAIAGETGK